MPWPIKNPVSERHDEPPGPVSAGTTRQWSARRRLALIGIVLVVGIAGADWQTIRLEREAAIANFVIAQTNLTNGMAAQTSRMLGIVDNALRDIQAELATPEYQSAEGLAAMLRDGHAVGMLQAHLPSLSGVDSLSIIDKAGHFQKVERDVLPSVHMGGADFVQQDIVQALRGAAAEAAVIGHPHQDPSTGRWSAFLARRLSDSSGGFVGGVAADVSLDELEDFYRFAMPSRRTITLLRRDGTIMLRFPHQDGIPGRSLPAGAPFYAAASQDGGYFIAPAFFDGTPVLAVVRPLRGLPLFVETYVAEADVLQSWRAQLGWMIWAGIVASTGGVLLVRLFGQQLKRLAAQNSELDEARSQLDIAISNVSQGICFFDSRQRLIVCNRRFGEIYRLPRGTTLVGCSFAELIDQWFARGGPTNVSPSDILRMREVSHAAGTTRQMVLELADGRTIAVCEQPLRDGGWVATHEDITDRRQAEERIRFLARHDVLTGLPNRALVMERIEQAVAGARRRPGFAVLFLDLDRFKAVNDTLGHAAGDDLLQSVAKRLAETVKSSDLVARLGGDEFVVLQDNVTAPEMAANLARRIIATVGAPYSIGGNEVVIGVSIGIELAVNDKTSADELLRNADTALYIAKGEGRGTFRFFEPDMDANMQNRHALERDLRCALERGEFVLHYQAIVSARSGLPCGFEALIRWNHPTRGLVLPQDFVPMAEETGLIIPIGEWVVQQACRDAATWPEHLHVSVNLSPIQFRSTGLVDMVHDALANSGLPAARLELEITESVLLQSNARNLAVMHEFRASGIGIVMDDFGVGYSSLKFLRQFPFQRIKIDQCFVQDLNLRSDAVCVVRAILGLCRDLDIKTIAEGVETEDQLRILLAEGCMDMQGFLFSRPVPAPLLDAKRARGTDGISSLGAPVRRFSQA